MKRKTVLFVDDDPYVLAALKRGLADEPYGKRFAAAGDGALDILAHGEVHVLVTDLSMPDMSGLKLLEIVRDEYPEVVCVLLSGQSQFDQAEASAVVRGVHAGEVFAFLAKPWDIEGKLKTTIEKALVAQQQSISAEVPEASSSEIDDVDAASSDSTTIDHAVQARVFSGSVGAVNDSVKNRRMQTGDWER